MKTLVLYYSRTGTTAKVAHALATALGADVAEIKCPQYRSGWFAYLRAGYDSVKGHLPPIEMADFTFENYDTVILGAPTWTSYPALPLRSFLAQHPKLPARVGLFLTSGGHSAPVKAERLVAELLDGPLAATLSIPQGEVVKGSFSEKIAAFVEHMRAGAD